ncbi:myosin-1 isoform X3 [Labeo rohita]|uniref:Myosin-1 isoform X3 n=1 Tax=Labeo rohita TaxID=84645 RepID=A0A498M8I9_LABRO|nr:myosin-1 isoform X3 [Labeo rohita]RXN38002.1 myosin-1 isoform X3 [Labeo rohita]
MFDESLNRSTNNKQMDLHLRYWTGDRVQSRYFGSQFLGHSTAQDLFHNFMSLLRRFVKKELLDVSVVKLARLDATDVQTWVPPKDVDIGIGASSVLKVNYSVCEKLGIMRSLCSPYHPQTNGLVEKLNGTIQRSLTKMVGEKPSSWDQHLKATLFALRTKNQITTKYSPYYLMFGREARYPSAVPSDYEVSHEKVEAMVEKEVLSDGSIQHKKPGQDDLSDLCHSCGEKNTNGSECDKWIECTECGKLYHWDCVGRPSTSGRYCCPACI